MLGNPGRYSRKTNKEPENDGFFIGISKLPGVHFQVNHVSFPVGVYLYIFPSTSTTGKHRSVGWFWCRRCCSNAAGGHGIDGCKGAEGAIRDECWLQLIYICKVSLIIIFGQVIAAGLYNCLLHILIAYNFGGCISKTPLKAVTCT